MVINRDILVDFFFVWNFVTDGKEMMWETRNDTEKCNHSYNNNRAGKIKGTLVDEGNRRGVSLGDALVFIVMTGRRVQRKIVPKRVWRQTCFDSRPAWVKILLRLARIQPSFLLYEAAILRADAEQVEVRPAAAPRAPGEVIKLSSSPAGSRVKALRRRKHREMELLNHHADASPANHSIAFHANNNLKVCTFPK